MSDPKTSEQPSEKSAAEEVSELVVEHGLEHAAGIIVDDLLLIEVGGIAALLLPLESDNPGLLTTGGVVYIPEVTVFGSAPEDTVGVHDLPDAPPIPLVVIDVNDLPDAPIDVHDLPDAGTDSFIGEVDDPGFNSSPPFLGEVDDPGFVGSPSQGSSSDPSTPDTSDTNSNDPQPDGNPDDSSSNNGQPDP